MAVDNVRVPKQGRLSDLAGWLAGDLGAARIRLFDNNHVYSQDDTPADYNESSFAGYAALGPVAWGAPFINLAGKAETDSPVLTWTFTAGVGTAVVYGIYITDAAQTILLAVIPFLLPVILSPAATTISRSVQMTASTEL